MAEESGKTRNYDSRDSYKIRLVISDVVFIFFNIELLMIKNGVKEHLDVSIGAF